MNESLSARPPADDIAPSILAPRPRLRVDVWVLAVAVLVAFVAGWVTATFTQTTVVSSCACQTPIASAPSETEEPDTEDDSRFVELTTRDLAEFAKDLGDIEITLDENGFWRLLSNSVELDFTVSQLRGYEAPKSIKKDWRAALTQLEKDVDAIEAGIGAQSEKEIRAAVEDARATVGELRDIVSRVD